jgi:hypothetical protein
MSNIISDVFSDSCDLQADRLPLFLQGRGIDRAVAQCRLFVDVGMPFIVFWIVLGVCMFAVACMAAPYCVRLSEKEGCVGHRCCIAALLAGVFMVGSTFMGIVCALMFTGLVNFDDVFDFPATAMALKVIAAMQGTVAVIGIMNFIHGVIVHTRLDGSCQHERDVRMDAGNDGSPT